MYAVVDVKDKQFKVREDDTLYVPYHSEADADQELTLDRVLLVSDGDGDVTLGTPTVEDASVEARVLEHVKGDKVIVFKKKRRKRYRVKRGHRQQYTQIQIESLNHGGRSRRAGCVGRAGGAGDQPR
ncbi:MAG: 50S ribosomal protein L21 [Bacteroidetes bacterium SW_7_64_58]|nr:MAG: 50S ribosomal protein L21 [Bacteroidetes bacterium SW_7_64_58]